MPQDLFGCQGRQGVYVNSAAPGSARVTINGVSELSAAQTVKTTADLPAGSYTNDQLAVTELPASFTSGRSQWTASLNATRDTKKVLFITGTTPTGLTKGVTHRPKPIHPRLRQERHHLRRPEHHLHDRELDRAG